MSTVKRKYTHKDTEERRCLLRERPYEWVKEKVRTLTRTLDVDDNRPQVSSLPLSPSVTEIERERGQLL